MQPERNFRTLTPPMVAVLGALGALGALMGCTGYLASPDDGAPAASANVSAASQTDAGGGAATLRNATSAGPGEVISSSWSAAIGTWCGPSEKQTLWLTTKPAGGGCDQASHKLYADAVEDSSEGLTVE